MTDIPPRSPEAVIEEAQRLLKDITPGNWHVGPHYRSDVESGQGRVAEARPFGSWQGERNAEFIAASKRLITDLVSCLLRQQEWSETAESEWTKFLKLTPEAEGLPPHEQAMAFLRVWANGYLLKGINWDIPNTMGLALTQAIKHLEAVLPDPPSRRVIRPEEQEQP